MKKTDSRWDLILWDGTRSISPAVRVRIVSWAAPDEVVDGMTGRLILGFLDKFVWMNVFGESHGRKEKQGEAFILYPLAFFKGILSVDDVKIESVSKG